jgi:hypothetical protein
VRAGRLAATGVALGCVVITFDAAPAAAHGIGGRADLPVPLSYFVVGASVVLIASFVALSFMWTTPRLQEEPHTRAIDGRWVAPFRYLLGAAGLLGFVLVVMDGLVDGKTSTLHISPVLVWVYFWLVIPFVVALLGDIWQWISPWRTSAVGLGFGDTTRLVPSRLGMWPAVAAFLAFTWLELVSPSSGDRRTLAIAAIVYTVYALIAARTYGITAGLGSFEVFENYNGIISRISPLDWTTRNAPAGNTAASGGRYGLSYRGWLRALPAMPDRSGLTAFIVAMIGTVTYDGLSGTEWWREVFGAQSRETWFGTFALLAAVAVIGLFYFAASAVAARIGGGEHTPRSVATSFIHSLVPIALAYAFAHYFTLILFEGQLLLHAASDPFGLGWDLFGTVTWRVEFFLSPEAIWYVQVAAILVGHVVGIVLAHDRALSEFGDSAARTQYAMLMLMVVLTSLGLFILAG